MQRLSIVLAVLALAVHPSSSLADLPFVRSWGSFGDGDGQFHAARNIAVATDGTVYVLDNQACRVQAFTPQGEFLRKFGSYGTGPGQFTSARGLAIGSANMVYIGGGLRILQFTASGSFVREWGSLGTGNGQFSEVTDVVADETGDVFVADMSTSGGRIQKFDANGNYLLQWPIATGAGIWVAYLAIGPGGRIFAFVVKIFDPFGGLYAFDGLGAPLGEMGGIDWTINGLGASPDGGPFAVRSLAPHVLQFDSSGLFLLDQWGPGGTGDGEFSTTMDVATSASGELYVIEDSRVQVFDARTVPVRSTSWGRLKANWR